MEFYLLIPFYSGLLIVVCAWIWLLACAFRAGIWWGLAGLVFASGSALVRSAPCAASCRATCFAPGWELFGYRTGALFVGCAPFGSPGEKVEQRITALVAYKWGSCTATWFMNGSKVEHTSFRWGQYP